MANEVTVSALLSYAKNAPILSVGTGSKQYSQTSAGKSFGILEMTATTAGTLAIILGSLATAARAWMWVSNLDTTNFLHILAASSGTKIMYVGPGEQYIFRFGDGVTAPCWQADTASVEVEYFLVGA